MPSPYWNGLIFSFPKQLAVFVRLLMLFIVVPLVDLALLLVIARWTHWTTTILLVILSGILGAWLAKRQSTSVGLKISDRLSRNELPSGLLTDGAMILFAAGLLITPGLITDLFGLSLLVPAIRNRYKQWTIRWLKKHFKAQVTKMGSTGFDEGVVDGEVFSSSEEKSGKYETENSGSKGSGRVRL